MFIDEATVRVKAGDGGNGCFSYLREKYRPKGPPNGGNGGKGGDICFIGSTNVHTLLDVSFRRAYNAERGEHGQGYNRYGHNAPDIEVKIPLGTIIYDEASGDLIRDCVLDGEKIIIAKGGRGGRGNAALVSRHNPNPEEAEAGKPGEDITLKLSLKVLADVGLVGRPNAGKSTLLSVISHAHPKIADYPFTTTEPQLGIVSFPEEFDSFVVADIPGLIEGSNTGRGLGIRFLKHIERTRLLAIMVECESPDLEAEAQILLGELRAYSEELASRPKIFIATKTDTVFEEDLKLPNGWLKISSATGEGVKELLQVFRGLLKVERTKEIEQKKIPQEVVIDMSLLDEL